MKYIYTLILSFALITTASAKTYTIRFDKADYNINEGTQVLPSDGYLLPAKVKATITGDDPHGRLLLTTADGHRLSCGMKEIVFL